MHKLPTISVSSHGDTKPERIPYDPLPDQCPVCHAHIAPKVIAGIFAGTSPSRRLDIAFSCTHHACESMFIGSYYCKEGASFFSGYYKLFRVAPNSPKEITLPDCINKISPSFVELYNQALNAETYKLDQLTGIGLRKALEFLMKDYAIAINPKNADSVKRKTLAECINQFIDDPNVKKCASRATWLGNDETHYIRKWVDKDINDLKELIRLTLNWLENVLLTKQYEQEMPDHSQKH